tara:strand:- start:23972 stop:25828 length:1857 start_codon:yes stop_codon:yes gene_type:complete
MQIYVESIPGAWHQMEDFYHYKKIQSAKGEEYGLFIIADGLSKHNGTLASHKAIYTVSTLLEDAIIKDEYNKNKLKSSILEANEALTSMGTFYTTLDVVVSDKSGLDIVHLGDSRIYSINNSGVHQLTPNEGGGSSMPTNFLGKTNINGVHLQDRLNYSRQDLPQLLFMTTDGLMSRVSDQNIIDSLQNYAQCASPQNILAALATEINHPSQKLLAISPYVFAAEFEPFVPKRLKRSSLKKKMEYLLDAYQKRVDPKLVEAVDCLYRKDDCIMLLIDFSNSLDKSLQSVQETKDEVIELRSKAKNLESRVSGYKVQIDNKKERCDNLTRENKLLKESITDKNHEYDHNLAELRKINSNLENKTIGYELQLENTQGQLKNTQEDLENLTNENSSIKSELTNMQHQKIELDKNITSQTIEISTLEKLKTTLNDCLIKVTESRDTYRANLQNKDREYTELFNKYNTIIEEKNSEISELNQRLQQLEADHSTRLALVKEFDQHHMDPLASEIKRNGEVDFTPQDQREFIILNEQIPRSSILRSYISSGLESCKNGYLRFQERAVDLIMYCLFKDEPQNGQQQQLPFAENVLTGTENPNTLNNAEENKEWDVFPNTVDGEKTE